MFLENLPLEPRFQSSNNFFTASAHSFFIAVALQEENRTKLVSNCCWDCF